MITQASLSVTVFILLMSNLVPAWSAYQSRMSIKTDAPSGSSLAERYLILGDWPAESDLSSVIRDNDKFIVTSAKTTINSGSTSDIDDNDDMQ
ncbi:hypothetical protein FM037_12875 [Shewanella psychropiezotolerans]|uniref:Uncharacterized protein n=2 Tax=Shewanellaceae TaxID=267890 RepID=A0ABX5X7D8_9GAMM|nr:hypothetical protein [Shewanella sp. YLB-07]QDO86657.1 hypothetical protein FM037_12875 [Shewanella psychropiezotolerans]